VFRKSFLAIFVLFAFADNCAAVREVAGPDEGGGPGSVRSHLGNYVVTAPSIEMAGSYARQAEDLRKSVARCLGDDRSYTVPTYITIRPVTAEWVHKGKWRVSVTHGASMRSSAAILSNRIENAVRFYVVYFYLLDASAVEAAANNSTIRDDQVPLWICAATVENLTREARETHRSYMLANLSEDRYIPLDELLSHNGRFADEQERALYFHECGSLLDYLISLPQGRKKVLMSLRDLWKRNDFMISLMWHFRDSFAALGELEKRWIEFTKERPQKYFDFNRLTAEETRNRLAQILAVEIVSIDEVTIEETVEETDLAGLMKHENSTVRLNMAFRKMAELQDLRLRAPEEYQEVLAEYILSVRALVNGKKWKFKRHYGKANKLFKRLESS
jgi:hypothetical protein